MEDWEGQGATSSGVSLILSYPSLVQVPYVFLQNSFGLFSFYWFFDQSLDSIYVRVPFLLEFSLSDMINQHL